ASSNMRPTYINPLGRDKSEQLTTPEERPLIAEQSARLDEANAGNVEGDEERLPDLAARVGRAPVRGIQPIDHHLPRSQRAPHHLQPLLPRGPAPPPPPPPRPRPPPPPGAPPPPCPRPPPGAPPPRSRACR